MHEILVYVVVDADGSYSVGETIKEAWERFAEDRLHYESDGVRVLRLKLKVEGPTLAHLDATVPANVGAATMTVSDDGEPIDLS